MKKIILLLSVISCTSVFSQTNECYKQEIIDTNLSKEVMWKNLKLWISSSFHNSKSVTDYEDKDEGTLVIKYRQPFGGNSNMVKIGAVRLLSNTSITVNLKDNKFRYIMPIGKVSVSIGDLTSLQNDMPIPEIRELINDLKVIVDVSREYFNEDVNWTIDENFDKIIEAYEKKLSNIQKTNKKGKSNPEWDSMNRRIEFLYDVKNGYCLIVNAVSISLKNAMAKNDDF